MPGMVAVKHVGDGFVLPSCTCICPQGELDGPGSFSCAHQVATPKEKFPRHLVLRHSSAKEKESPWLHETSHKHHETSHKQVAWWDAQEHTLSKQWEEAARLADAVDSLDVLVQRGCHVTLTIFYRLLRRCMAQKDLVCARRVHGLAVSSGYGSDAFLANQFISMYASHGALEDAVQVFAGAAAPNAHMWCSIILAHARHGQPSQAITLYRQMRKSGLQPDSHIFMAVLKACASAGDLDAGKEVHAHVRAAGSVVEENVFVGNSLVHMYAKCGSLCEARRVFDGLSTRDVVTWTAMINGYAEQGMGREALSLYAGMRELGIGPPDRVTFACLLKACASIGSDSLLQGQELHAEIARRRLHADLMVANSLVDMYAKCGSLEHARGVFDALPVKDVVSWNVIIAGYSQQGFGQEALVLYANMVEEAGTEPSRVTYLCLLQACASVGALHQGKRLHAHIQQRGLGADIGIGNGLVDMYCKCGSLEDASSVFHSMPTRDVVTWNALLNGYAQHGNAEMAMQAFQEMRREGVEPDDTTFLTLVVACSHEGLVDEGQQFFRVMVEEYGIVVTESHRNCMVDLLARSGRLEEAEDILEIMTFQNYVVGWRCLLSACKMHGDLKRGKLCFDRLVELEPGNAASYVLMGNIYANVGRWEDVEEVERWRRGAGAWKKPAKACIEVMNMVHEFTVGEERADISPKLKSVNARLKEEGGHVPQTSLVLKAVSEEEKEDSLCGHAEKLALAYGLLNTPDGTTLLVTKNLRMCNDCHSSTKIMSRLEQRDIIVRDAHRVHRFVDGSCSCGDRH